MTTWFRSLVENVRRHLILRKSAILLWHVAGLVLTYYLAYWLRFDGAIPKPFLQTYTRTLLPFVVIHISAFAGFRLYTGIWSYFSLHDVIRILQALCLAFSGFVVAVWLQHGDRFAGFPRSVAIMEFFLLAAWMIGGRLTVRWLREYYAGRNAADMGGRVLLVGSLEELNFLIPTLASATAELRGSVVGIVTDEPARHRLTLRGIPVRGPIADVGRLARLTRADCILIVPPYTRPADMNRIVSACEAEGVSCEFRMIPAWRDLATGKIKVSPIRRVEVEDLLGRAEHRFDRAEVRSAIAESNILVTGAGGSIGSELVRQIVPYEPATLVLLDNSEFNLYAVDRAIRREQPDRRIVSVVGDAGDAVLMTRLLREYRIRILYHAAAYKHVPLMETNVPSCVSNNTLATATLATVAEAVGVERMVLISTDKAVRPSSVMGASKRLAERIVLERPRNRTTFVVVRFGNVLGSSGSVVPLFRQQIAEGGPVTVTTENATRFFLSIPEAVDLVLQASVIGQDRDIMVLEMGKPVRVADLARHMIELSGLRVGTDIAIVYTGLRPGEKEHEELMTADENVVRTPYEKIWVLRAPPDSCAPPVDCDRLAALVREQDAEALRRELARLIPEAVLSRPDAAKL